MCEDAGFTRTVSAAQFCVTRSAVYLKHNPSDALPTLPPFFELTMTMTMTHSDEVVP